MSGFSGSPVDQSAWTSYAPTVTSGSGSITTLGTCTGYYKQVGKTLFLNLVLNVTTAGTAGNDITATLPAGLTARNNAAIPGKEFSVTGKTINAYVLASGNTVGARYYDNTSVFANGILVAISGCLEIN